MKKKLNSKLYLPLILAIIIYLLAYQIPKLLIPVDKTVCLSSYIDSLIPFYAPAITIYIGAFLQWANAVLIACAENKEKGYRYASAIIIGSLIGFTTYMVYPTSIVRPEVNGSSFFDWWCRLVFSIDNVINACPSFHCFCSTIVLFIINDCDNLKKSTLYINILISILVFISTLLTKQHVFIDVVFGTLLALVSFIVSKKLTFTKIFDKLNEKFHI